MIYRRTLNRFAENRQSQKNLSNERRVIVCRRVGVDPRGCYVNVPRGSFVNDHVLDQYLAGDIAHPDRDIKV